MNGQEALALGQQLGQVLFENQALHARVERLEEILLERGAGTLTQLSPEATEATVDPMADFAQLGEQAKKFVAGFGQTAPPTAPKTPPATT